MCSIEATRTQEYQALRVFGKDSRRVLLKSLDRSGPNAGPIRSCDADEIRGDSPLRDDIGGLHALDIGSLHVRPCFCERTVQVDATRSVFDHRGIEARLARVECGPCYAEVGCKAGDVTGSDPARLEIGSKPGGRFAIGLDKRRIA